jgi:ketosteroid isomerase-like protein
VKKLGVMKPLPHFASNLAVDLAAMTILARADRAVIVGELATRINTTGKIIESAFAIILAASDGEITRFQMLEDSFAVSRQH